MIFKIVLVRVIFFFKINEFMMTLKLKNSRKPLAENKIHCSWSEKPLRLSKNWHDWNHTYPTVNFLLPFNSLLPRVWLTHGWLPTQFFSIFFLICTWGARLTAQNVNKAADVIFQLRWLGAYKWYIIHRQGACIC